MNVRGIARAVIGIAVSAVACLLLVRAVDLPAAATNFDQIDVRWLTLPLVVIGLQFLIRARRWAMLLSSAARTTVAASSVLEPLAIGYFANTVLPARLGEVARMVVVARRERIGLPVSAASVIVERIVDLSALGTLALVVVARVTLPAALGVVLLALGPILLIRAAPAALVHVTAWLPAALRDPLARGLTAVAATELRTLTAAYGLSIVAWTGDIAIVWLAAQAIGASATVGAALAIAVGAALATTIPSAGGYIGTYELGAVAIGGIGGIAPSDALAVALVAHVFAVVPLALAGLVATARVGFGSVLPRGGDVDLAPRAGST